MLAVKHKSTLEEIFIALVVDYAIFPSQAGVRDDEAFGLSLLNTCRTIVRTALVVVDKACPDTSSPSLSPSA